MADVTATATMDDKPEEIFKQDNQNSPTEKSDQNENGNGKMGASITNVGAELERTVTQQTETIFKQDNQNIPTEKSDQNENGNKEMVTSSTNEGAERETTVTQQTETNLTDSANVIIEHVKEEMEISLTNTNVKNNEDLEIDPSLIDQKMDTEQQKSVEQNDGKLNAVQKVTVGSEAIDIAKSTEVPESTEAPVNESEGSSQLVNPLKRKRCRPPKRKRKPKIHRATDENAPTEIIAEIDLSVDTSMEMEISKDDVEYCLTVSNLPNSWSFMDIKNYIDTQCGPVDEIEMIKDDKTGKGAIRLSYQIEEECKRAMEKLKDKEIAGNKLVMEINVVSLVSDTEEQSDTTEVSNKPWKPDLDSWEVDLHGMYGLKLQYLRSLGITPPLDKWVHVSNFRCDKAELRDVMEMAGDVQMCSVFTASHRYANVMYSHPLEAVQAVSMLNNQMFYGQLLKIAMDRSPLNTILLPKGLTNIGKGLGLSGKPLRNIVKHYERFVENKDCLINPTFFDVPANHLMNLNNGFETLKFEVKSVEEFNYPLTTDKVKKVAEPKATMTRWGAPTTKAVTPVQSTVAKKPVQSPKPVAVQSPAYIIPPPKPATSIKTNFTPQNFQQRAAFPPNFRPGPFAAPPPIMNGQLPPPQVRPMSMMQQGPPGPQQHLGLAGPPQGQFVCPFPGPGLAPQVGWGPPGPMMQGPPGPGPPAPMFANEPVKLILSNLPPSTTFKLLCEKMSEWGHVVCIQLTTPGSAVVTFANRMQADACLQHYNGRNIDNYFIQLKYA